MDLVGALVFGRFNCAACVLFAFRLLLLLLTPSFLLVIFSCGCNPQLEVLAYRSLCHVQRDSRPTPSVMGQLCGFGLERHYQFRGTERGAGRNRGCCYGTSRACRSSSGEQYQQERCRSGCSSGCCFGRLFNGIHRRRFDKTSWRWPNKLNRRHSNLRGNINELSNFGPYVHYCCILVRSTWTKNPNQSKWHVSERKI